jgi:hypothetical protein
MSDLKVSRVNSPSQPSHSSHSTHSGHPGGGGTIQVIGAGETYEITGFDVDIGRIGAKPSILFIGFSGNYRNVVPAVRQGNRAIQFTAPHDLPHHTIDTVSVTLVSLYGDGLRLGQTGSL